MNRPLSRREFCAVSGGALVALQLPACGPGIPAIISAGPPASIVLNQAVFYQPQRLFVCRDAGGVFAVSSNCQHMHCDVDFRAAKLDYLCPCHSSRYDYTGALLEGPSLRPLFHLKVTLDDVTKEAMVDSTAVVDAAERLV